MELVGAQDYTLHIYDVDILKVVSHLQLRLFHLGAILLAVAGDGAEDERQSLVFFVACFLVYGVAHILNHGFEVGIVGASSITVALALMPHYGFDIIPLLKF